MFAVVFNLKQFWNVQTLIALVLYKLIVLGYIYILCIHLILFLVMLSKNLQQCILLYIGILFIYPYTVLYNKKKSILVKKKTMFIMPFVFSEVNFLPACAVY